MFNILFFYLDFATLFIRLPNHAVIAEEQGETVDETIVITLKAESVNFYLARKVDLEKLGFLLPETQIRKTQFFYLKGQHLSCRQDKSI